MTYPHTHWLAKSSRTLKSSDGVDISVYELKIGQTDANSLSAWAKHFREHYCLDTEIDKLRSGTGKSRAQYLTDLVFPDAKEAFGPATRSGDFAEILAADLLEDLLGYWVPRTRYGDKKVRNESPKGSDIIGLKIVHSGKPSKKDSLLACEAKAQLSGTSAKDRLQDAVNDSDKDQFRLAESLNATKRRLYDLGRDQDALRIERFQDPLGAPYTYEAGAAAILCNAVYAAKELAGNTDCSMHKTRNNLLLLVVHADQFMKIVHALYGRAANEA